ncbi:DEAD/DEAH box helicase [Microbulbifer sp.]|uniref:DEAD/DEAH box helicase n=1 Tax=Microbulbifer sp. TaxID=1908541 RepID=UPI003F3533F9
MTSSFLQRLRREQGLPDTPDTRRLHYRLSQDGRRLSLLLAKPLAGGQLENPSAYRLQPAHWQRPPGFLDGDDLAALPQLHQLCPREAEEGGYRLPVTTPLSLLRALAESGRLLLADAGPLAWGSPEAVPFGWQTDELGRQRLDWQPSPGQLLLPCDPPACLVPQRRQLVPVADVPAASAREWLRRRPQLAPEQLNQFLSRYCDELEAAGLPLPRALPERRLAAEPQPLLALSSAGGADRLRLHFVYRWQQVECRVDAGDDESFGRYHPESGELLRFQRDRSKETAYRRALEQALVEYNPRLPSPDAWEFPDWRDPMTNALPALRAQGWLVEIAPDFRQHFIAPGAVHLEAAPEGVDWFELALQVEVDGELLPLMPLLADCARRYSRAQLEVLGGDLPLALPDGRQLLLPAARLARWLALLGELCFEEAAGERLRLPRAQLDRLHYLADDELEVSAEAEALVEGVRRHLAPAAPPRLPEEWCATLRPYQLQGLAWLQQRRALQTGGLLADDMGLGKTVQLLAHLSVERAAGRLAPPALVVAPSSLLDNWLREAERFAPRLRVELVRGPGRHRRWQRLGENHLLLTSYALLARDLEHWRAQPLSAVILDEAQAIKNAHSQMAGCARELQADYRLCLTGTPVENHLGELWSLFEFMLPGFLSTEASFNRCYRKPIERDGDEGRARDLLERIAPFVLRRTKAQVATDLPPKTEISLRLPLQGAQRDLYETLREEGLRQIHGSVADGGGRLMVLNLLTRLRLLCCDPGLADPAQADAGSAKREYLREVLPQLVEEGRSVLVFSQFVGMLRLVAADLQRLGIPSLSLTGRSRNRGELVDRFQAGAAPVFLVSLKAGGSGLNLTRADTVIHCDPWWNAAAEAQANDRAHRIGQDKPVFVYKLLAEDTVEEKMQQLQARKRQLAEQVYRAAEAEALEFQDLYSLLAEGPDA